MISFSFTFFRSLPSSVSTFLDSMFFNSIVTVRFLFCLKNVEFLLNMLIVYKQKWKFSEFNTWHLHFWYQMKKIVHLTLRNILKTFWLFYIIQIIRLHYTHGATAESQSNGLLCGSVSRFYWRMERIFISFVELATSELRVVTSRTLLCHWCTRSTLLN